MQHVGLWSQPGDTAGLCAHGVQLSSYVVTYHTSAASSTQWFDKRLQVDTRPRSIHDGVLEVGTPPSFQGAPGTRSMRLYRRGIPSFAGFIASNRVVLYGKNLADCRFACTGETISFAE